MPQRRENALAPPDLSTASTSFARSASSIFNLFLPLDVNILSPAKTRQFKYNQIIAFMQENGQIFFKKNHFSGLENCIHAIRLIFRRFLIKKRTLNIFLLHKRKSRFIPKGKDTMKRKNNAEKVLFSSSGQMYSLTGLCNLLTHLKSNSCKCVDNPALGCEDSKNAGECPENEYQISGDRPE